MWDDPSLMARVVRQSRWFCESRVCGAQNFAVAQKQRATVCAMALARLFKVITGINFSFSCALRARNLADPVIATGSCPQQFPADRGCYTPAGQ